MREKAPVRSDLTIRLRRLHLATQNEAIETILRNYSVFLAEATDAEQREKLEALIAQEQACFIANAKELMRLSELEHIKGPVGTA